FFFPRYCDPQSLHSFPTRRSSDLNIKLIDFGIASNAASRRITFAKLSQTMGTPDYISPEQVKGKRGDARSDLYATGIMLYEMLRSEEHTSELQSPCNLVCRLLLEK